MSDGFRVGIDNDPTGRVCVVTLVGSLDPVAAEELQPVVDQLHRDGHRDFVLDLTGLRYVGSLGLRVLVGLAGRVKAGGSVGLCGVSAPVREILDLTKVSTLLRIYPSLADAIDGARSH